MGFPAVSAIIRPLFFTAQDAAVSDRTTECEPVAGYCASHWFQLDPNTNATLLVRVIEAVRHRLLQALSCGAL